MTPAQEHSNSCFTLAVLLLRGDAAMLADDIPPRCPFHIAVAAKSTGAIIITQNSAIDALYRRSTSVLCKKLVPKITSHASSFLFKTHEPTHSQTRVIGSRIRHR